MRLEDGEKLSGPELAKPPGRRVVVGCWTGCRERLQMSRQPLTHLKNEGLPFSTFCLGLCPATDTPNHEIRQKIIVIQCLGVVGQFKGCLGTGNVAPVKAVLVLWLHDPAVLVFGC